MPWADCVCRPRLRAQIPADSSEDAEAKPLPTPPPSPHQALSTHPTTPSCGSGLVAGVSLATSCRPSETR